MIDSLRRLRARLVLLPLAVAALGGCATFQGTPHEADERLAEIVGEWRAQRSAGKGCLDEVGPRRPVVDCGRLLKELDLLALEFPRNPDVLFAAAGLAQEDGRPEKAQTYLSALFALRPSHPEAAILRARIAIGEGNLPLAERTLDQQIELVPDHPGLRETSASVAYLRGDWDAAEQRLRAAEQLGAPDWRIAYHRGLIAEAQGRTDEASAHYRRSLDANPGFERARSRLAGMAVIPASD